MKQDNQKPESNIKSTIEAAVGLVKAVPVYQDAIQPSAKQIGKSLEAVTKTINIALTPIRALVWGYEQIEKFVTSRVAEKLKNVQEENILTPAPNLAVPIIEALRYTGHDENLRELFANLLATSMDKETQDKAHPGYVEIIKNLSSEEALLLNAFIAKFSYPIIDVKINYKDNKGFVTLLSHYSHLPRIIALKRKDLTPSYLDNLCRLGILQIPPGTHLTAENTYEPLENDSDLEPYRIAINNAGHKIEYGRGLVQVTTFGQQFIDNVVIEKK